MPNIFALQGPGNCGKSSTLVHLYQTLQSKYPAATIQTVHAGPRDIAVIMRGVNGLVIGIESQGDPNSRLPQSLSTFVAAKCDIIFCACRTSGMTVGWVNSLSTIFSIHFVTQVRVANNYGASNAVMAAMLMRQAGI
ncbi:hypothetical protein [Burkholderia gladioli]|uniref:hypothetical protein n=1 Tax=Burkholderia gladioli TaxID=28095 RepID=UPI00163EC930|nr:hypothetical protein [Burkholderia gladioli]